MAKKKTTRKPDYRFVVGWESQRRIVLTHAYDNGISGGIRKARREQTLNQDGATIYELVPVVLKEKAKER